MVFSRNHSFLFGAASSHFQDAQDLSIHSDWTELLTKQGRLEEYLDPLHATMLHKHPARYVNTIKELRLNCFRFSIDWPLLQPEEGKWNEDALQWYDTFIDTLCGEGIEPIVTMNHFTHPSWFIEKGGWERCENSKYFLLFVEKIAERYKGKVRYWITINEPMVYINFSYIQGQRPPYVKSGFRALKTIVNMLRTHNKVYKLIHKLYGKDEVFVSLALALWPIVDATMQDHFKQKIMNYFGCYLQCDIVKKHVDFWGINYYGPLLMDKDGIEPFGEERVKGPNIERTAFGWAISAHAFGNVLQRLKAYRKPIFITENGLYAKDEEQAKSYYKQHMDVLLNFYRENKESKSFVIGITTWCLVDNFEWDYGYPPKFGITSYDPANAKTFSLKPRGEVYIGYKEKFR